MSDEWRAVDRIELYEPLICITPSDGGSHGLTEYDRYPAYVLDMGRNEIENGNLAGPGGLLSDQYGLRDELFLERDMQDYAVGFRVVKLEARITAHGHLDIRTTEKSGDDTWAIEMTHCGKFTVMWAEQKGTR